MIIQVMRTITIHRARLQKKQPQFHIRILRATLIPWHRMIVWLSTAIFSRTCSRPTASSQITRLYPWPFRMTRNAPFQSRNMTTPYPISYSTRFKPRRKCSQWNLAASLKITLKWKRLFRTQRVLNSRRHSATTASSFCVYLRRRNVSMRRFWKIR